MTNQTMNAASLLKGKGPDDAPVLPAAQEIFQEIVSNDNEKYQWLDDNTLEINGVPDMEVHKAVLKAQELGKELKIQRKTIITIAD